MIKINHRELSWAIRDLIDPELSSTQILILHTALACSDQDFEFHYGAKTFGRICRVDERTIQRNVKKLIEMKYLKIIKKGGKGAKDPNHYRLEYKQIVSNTINKIAQDISKLSTAQCHTYDQKIPISTAQNPNKYGTVPPEASQRSYEQIAPACGAQLLSQEQKHEPDPKQGLTNEEKAEIEEQIRKLRGVKK